MKFCITGYGSIAGFHRDALLAMDDAEIDSIVGRVIEPTREFAEACGAPLATLDLDEALNRPGLDAVLITSPSQVHVAQATAALEAGKHVLLEIPMSIGLAEGEALCDLADRVGRTLMICHTQRYWAASQQVKRRIDAGELHPIHYHVEWHFFRRENINWMGRRRSWTDNLLWHHGGHVIDHSMWLFGEEPSGARAWFGPSGNPLGIPLDVSAQMRFPGGGLATFALTYNAIVPETTQRITLVCEEDKLTFLHGVLTDRDGDVIVEESNEEAIPRQNREFIDAVTEGREPFTSGRAILPAWRALQQMESGG